MRLPLYFLTFAVWMSCLAFGVPAHAATDTHKSTAPAIADIKPLQDWQQSTHANLDYIGSQHGMDVWIATRNGAMDLIYTTADKQAMIFEGVLIGPDNKNLTAVLQQAFVVANPDRATTMLQTVRPVPSSSGQTDTSASKSEQLWSDLTSAHTATFGTSAAPLLYMIVDMKCDHCRAMWQKLQPALAGHTLQVKLLPIAILGRPSEKAASALLSQADPAKAWINHMNGQDITDMTQAGIAAFVGNQKIAGDYKLTQTPTLIYRSKRDGKIKIVLGAPKDITAFWQDAGIETAVINP